MLEGIGLLFTLTSGLTIALILGFIAQKIKLSPIVGYLVAGILVSPHSPGFVADLSIAQQCADIGVVLLMFGVGIHFKLADLIAVKRIAIVGALSQIFISTTITTIAIKLLGWPWISGIILGMSIAVASTVVLTRVFTDNKLINTPTGHIAIGWLIIEDIFTILVLVLLPIFVNKNPSDSNVFITILLTILKLSLFIVFALVGGKKIIPFLLKFIARTGNRELFILSILVIALGIAVCASEFFGASMALGAFLAGMVVGQSDFSTRVTAEAIQITDVFAVLFFVSVGMLFNLSSLSSSWGLTIVLFLVVLLIKPIVAITLIKSLKVPTKKAIQVGLAIGQIGEFSFILASLAVTHNLITHEAYNSIIFVSILTITINTIINYYLNTILNFLSKKGFFKIPYTIDDEIESLTKDIRHVIIVGYGPAGEEISKILVKAKIDVIIIEMNIDTVKKIKDKKQEYLHVIYGDACQQEVLLCAGIKTAEAFIISSTFAPAKEIIDAVKNLNSRVKILINTNYIRQARYFRKDTNLIVHSGEGAAALSLAKEVFTILNLTNFEEEIPKIYKELL